MRIRAVIQKVICVSVYIQTSFMCPVIISEFLFTNTIKQLIWKAVYTLPNVYACLYIQVFASYMLQVFVFTGFS